MNKVVNELKLLGDKVRQGGTEKARQRHVAKGKMLPRQR